MIKINGDNFVVTGGAGFIGSHIIEELIKQGKQVVCLDNGPINRIVSEKWCGNVKFRALYSDITKMNLGDRYASLHKAGAVFHQACSKCTVCREDPLKDLLTNAWGTFQIAHHAAKSDIKVIHASTGSVYGDNIGTTLESNRDKPYARTAEYTQYAPKSFYGVSKLAAEQYLRAFKEYYGLRFVALRYFHVYGPRQDAGPNGGVVAIFITKMLKGEPITVFGDGNQTRSFTYVKDVVAANFHAANSEAMEGQYYNVASGIRVSLNQLIEALSDIIGVKPNVEYREVRKGDIKHFNVSNAKLAASGYCQWSDFEDALRETVGWYRANS